MYRSAKRNEEFNSFFKEFKEKNKGKWESVINGMDVEEDLLKNETQTEKQEEIEMLQEFERRRKFKTAYDTLNKTEEERGENDDKRLRPKKKQKAEVPDQVEDILKADPEKGELYDSRY
jgi:hypothetical protein